MDPVRIPCPACGKSLKVKDESLLGRKVKCPACSEPFVLTDPRTDAEEELVEFELAAPADAPAVGKSARWVPDEPETLSAAASAPNVVTMEPPSGPFVSDEPKVVLYGDRDTGGVARMKELRRKNRRRRNVGIAVGIVTALAIGGAWYGITSYQAGVKARDLAAAKAKKKAEAPTIDRSYVGDKAALEQNLVLAEEYSPTNGDPIDTRYVPDGASIVFHLRPKEILGGDAGLEMIACLNDVWEWGKSKIAANVGAFPLEQVDELTLFVFVLSKDRDPFVASVVRFESPIPNSEYVKLGENVVRDVPLVRANDDWAYMLQDENRTLAVCPNRPDLVGEMAEATGLTRATTGEGVFEVLPHTDHERHFTVAFRPADLVIYENQLFREDVRPLAEQVVRWFGEDVRGVAWSVHLGKNLYSDLVLSPEVASAANRLVSPMQMHGDFRERLDQLPPRMLDMVRYMEPETVGRQQLIGRFPAMTKAFAVGTLGGIDADTLQLVTVIEGDRAAPNLAAASILAWDQSKRTDFDRTLTPAAPTAGLPKLIVDRLRMTKVEAEFNGLAMDEVFNYISDEAKVKFFLDGDALKDAGFTKVMRQTMHLGTVPAIDAVGDIVKRYQERDKAMALVIDEQAGVATITTVKFAEKNGQTPYPFP